MLAGADGESPPVDDGAVGRLDDVGAAAARLLDAGLSGDHLAVLRTGGGIERDEAGERRRGAEHAPPGAPPDLGRLLSQDVTAIVDFVNLQGAGRSANRSGTGCDARTVSRPRGF